MSEKIILGDCRAMMPARGPYDMILADPPYGETSLGWDKAVRGWLALAYQSLKPTGSMWVFGSMRSILATAAEFNSVGWRLVQDIVWEKHNGSCCQADRFRRVHEFALHWSRQGDRWEGVYNRPPKTNDATRKTVRRKKKPAHWGAIGGHLYESHDGGPRLARSVVRFPSMHGRAIHPTEKPTSLIKLLVETSCPPGGLVGDWFAGSGAGGEACKLAGRSYLGCESDPEMFRKASERLGVMLPFGGAVG